MKNKKQIVLSLLLAGILSLQSIPQSTNAKTVVYEEKSLSGFSYYLNNYYQARNATKDNSSNIYSSLLSKTTDIPDNIAVANVQERLNIRKGPGTEYDIVGYLTKNAACLILDDADSGWVEIISGDVRGYTKIEYLFAGEEGQEIAQELGTLTAKVIASSINLRSTPSTESEDNIICVLSYGTELKVLEEIVLNKSDEGSALWVKVSYNGQEGYLAKKYVDVAFAWTEAIEVVTPTPTPVPTQAPVVTETKEEKESKKESEETKEDKKDKKDNQEKASTTKELRKQIIKTAEDHLGLRYSWGKSDLNVGADCSGFCLAVYRECGIDTSGFNRCSYDIAVSKKGKAISRSELKKGDYVFYGKNGHINHVAMYYGNGQIIHESSSAGKAIISSLDYSTPMKYVNFLGD